MLLKNRTLSKTDRPNPKTRLTKQLASEVHRQRAKGRIRRTWTSIRTYCLHRTRTIKRSFC